MCVTVKQINNLVSINQLNNKAPEKSRANEELAGYRYEQLWEMLTLQYRLKLTFHNSLVLSRSAPIHNSSLTYIMKKRQLLGPCRVYRKILCHFLKFYKLILFLRMVGNARCCQLIFSIFFSIKYSVKLWITVFFRSSKKERRKHIWVIIPVPFQWQRNCI
jgi:hypothetical protein